jgi:hypothetical protein
MASMWNISKTTTDNYTGSKDKIDHEEFHKDKL